MMTSRLKATIVAAVFVFAACGDDDGGGTPDAAGGTPDAAGGQAPVISQVKWQRTGNCTAGTPGDYTVTTTFSDPDTANAQLTLSGGVASCTPNPFTGNPQVIRCPNQAPYGGSVTVRDPQGNKDTATFTIQVCTDGMVNP